MYTNYQQLIISLILGAYGTVALIFDRWIASAILYLFAAFYLMRFLRLGRSLWLTAAQKSMRQLATKILDLFSDPDKLTPRKQAYYWLTRAHLANQENDSSAAEKFYDLALNCAGLLERGEALPYLRLAEIHHLQGFDEKALNECRMAALCRPNRTVSNEIKQLEAQLERTISPPREPASLFGDNK